MELIDLKTNLRKTTGNGPARRLRRSGQIPAVLYGPETESILLSVDANEFEKVLKKSISGQVLLNLIIENGKTFTRSAMVKELQTHPVSRDFLHIDFFEIAMDRKIRVKVPVVVTGKSKGVETGGILQIVRREQPELPEENEISISDRKKVDLEKTGELPAEKFISDEEKELPDPWEEDLDYELPGLELLQSSVAEDIKVAEEELTRNAELLKDKLKLFCLLAKRK